MAENPLQILQRKLKEQEPRIQEHLQAFYELLARVDAGDADAKKQLDDFVEGLFLAIRHNRGSFP